MDLCICVCKCVGNAFLYIIHDTFRPSRLISTSTLKFENISMNSIKGRSLQESFVLFERETVTMIFYVITLRDLILEIIKNKNCYMKLKYDITNTI